MRVLLLVSGLLVVLPLAAQQENDPAWKAGYAVGQILGYGLIFALAYWGFRRLFRKGRKE